MRPFEIRLPADARMVPAARREAGRICREWGVSDSDCTELDIALGEALANAVMHGLPGEAAAKAGYRVCISAWQHNGFLIIQVQDNGRGFNPPAPPYQMPAAHTHEMNGRGLPLMQMLTDAMAVCRGDIREGGVAVYLMKSLTAH